MATQAFDIGTLPLHAHQSTATDGSHRFVTAAGARVHYVHAGAGHPVVLIHGLVGSASNWRRNLRGLAAGRSVYAIDMINMGQSQRVRGLNAGLEATADRLLAFLDALGLAQADLVGHSHGGAVAMMLAARHPERVRSLVLFAPANPYCTLGHRLVRIYSGAVGRLLARLGPWLPKRLQHILLSRMYGDPARIAPGTLEGYTDGSRVPGTVTHVLDIVRRWFADMAVLKTVLPQLADVPTLLVWGDRDRAVSLASGRCLRRELPLAELRVICGAGHIAFEELPDESNRIVLEWLTRDLRPGEQQTHAAPLLG